MAKPEPEDDQDKRIEDLRRRAEELCGGQMGVRALDDYPAEIEETFWEAVVKFDETPWTTHFHQLESAGVSLPPPDSLNDQELVKDLPYDRDRLLPKPDYRSPASQAPN